jgi:hypothetical protein
MKMEMRPVETVLRRGKGGIKENDISTSINVTVYPQYNNMITKIKLNYKK